VAKYSFSAFSTSLVCVSPVLPDHASSTALRSGGNLKFRWTLWRFALVRFTVQYV
jgi:hypothetical protein